MERRYVVEGEIALVACAYEDDARLDRVGGEAVDCRLHAAHLLVDVDLRDEGLGAGGIVGVDVDLVARGGVVASVPERDAADLVGIDGSLEILRACETQRRNGLSAVCGVAV